MAVGLILALLAGGVAFVTLQRAAAAPKAGVAAITKPVVVAARPLPAGTRLMDADLTVQNLPAEIVPEGALATVAEASGQVTTITLNIGEMVLAHHLTRPDITGENLAFTLPEGKVAVTLSPDDLLSRVQVIQAGDRVDILYSLEIPSFARPLGQVDAKNAAPEKDKRQYTFGTLQNVVVVSVARGGVGEKAQASIAPTEKGGMELGAVSAYILALEPQDALVLKYLKDANAIMDLALRNIADETEHPMQPVDLLYLIDKYELPVR
jgi:pilus assembly protein CpaB